MGLSHLLERRSRHNFEDCVSRLCSLILEVENIYFLQCLHYENVCMGFINKVNQIDQNSSHSDDDKVSLFLYCDLRFADNKNNFILSALITYFWYGKTFDFPLIKWCMNFNISMIIMLLFISSDITHLVVLLKEKCTKEYNIH